MGRFLIVIRVSPRFPAQRCIIVDHTMNRLASILPPAQVLVSVDVTSKKRAFEEAGLLFESLHGLSRALITDSLFARERLGSTGLGHGVAIPHGRIKGLTAPMAAVFQLASPIGFDAPDEQPVGLLIFSFLMYTMIFVMQFRLFYIPSDSFMYFLRELGNRGCSLRW